MMGSSSSSSRRRHCHECNLDYDTTATRDRLCPTCGTAFATTAISSTQPDPWFAGSFPADAAEDREAQQRRNNAGEAREELPDIEAMRQRMLDAINSQSFDAEGGEGGPGGRRGLSEEDIARLPLSQLHTTSSMLMSVSITLESSDGQPPFAMECIPGAFSPVPPEGFQFQLLQADPLLADTLPLRNQEACRGKVLVTQRGKQTFGAMLVAARAAGALGVVVVNSVPLWPYLMRDGKGEAKLEEGKEEEQSAACFIVMVSQAHGEELLRRLAAAAAAVDTTAAAAALTGRLAVSQVEKECLICISAFEENDTILRLPCQHTYHEECAKRWLNLQSTCPACRMEVKPRREG